MAMMQKMFRGVQYLFLMWQMKQEFGGNWYENGTKPKVGDIILFNPTCPGPDKYYSSHVGIVYKVDSKNVYTVEGNTNGSNDNSIVTTQSYGISNKKINGYYRPNWSSVKSYLSREGRRQMASSGYRI